MAKLILGTMNFGIQTDLKESTKIVARFFDMEKSSKEIDTAFVYNDGESERILGKIIKSLNISDHKVATKVNPRVTGKLDRESINYQLEESLNRLQLDQIETLYIHFPDEITPLTEILETLNSLYLKGKFSRLGISNYSAWKVVQIVHICKENNWIVPSVYQGLYNPLSRLVEPELIPALREYEMGFYAYNPLAGGILSGKYSTFQDSVTEGRFSVRPNYKDRYWNEKLFKIVDNIKSVSNKHNTTIIESTFKWLNFHSVLSENDGILLGVSSEKQLQTNLSILSQPLLSSDIIQTFEMCWDEIRSTCPSYFRGVDKK